ncbi:MAG: HAD family phosphatase [Theionarchaea archaeon]|nr:HAD family phosphatase [Theionarchaea archaeon]MBU7037180.1 HAD family phosphatase [Theionarchaea archaeon]
MTYRLCVFDIDGVLNPPGCPVQKESIDGILELERGGLDISFASGKHPWYITGGLVFSGLLRQDTVIIGESGGHVFFPREKEKVLYTRHINDIKKVRQHFFENRSTAYEVWEEPKETLFSLFPRKWEDIPQVSQDLKDIIQEERLNLYVIAHVDAVDVMQNGLSKKTGLTVVRERLDIPFEDMIGVGDGMNDLEMLSCVGYPVAVGNAHERVKEIVREREGYVSQKNLGEGVLEAAQHITRELL